MNDFLVLSRDNSEATHIDDHADNINEGATLELLYFVDGCESQSVCVPRVNPNAHIILHFLHDGAFVEHYAHVKLISFLLFCRLHEPICHQVHSADPQ